MRTTVIINDALLARVRELMAKRGTTMRALVEEGLRRVIESDDAESGTFELRDASVGEGGLRDDVTDESWETLRTHLYPDP